MWTALWIRIPRRLSHRIGLYHKPTLPCGSSPNTSKNTPKAWDGAGHVRKIYPDTYGTFPKDRAGVRAYKNEKNFSQALQAFTQGIVAAIQKLRANSWAERDVLGIKAGTRLQRKLPSIPESWHVAWKTNLPQLSKLVLSCGALRVFIRIQIPVPAKGKVLILPSKYLKSVIKWMQPKLHQRSHPFQLQMRLTQPTHYWPERSPCPFKLLKPLQFFYIHYLACNQKLWGTQRSEKL